MCMIVSIYLSLKWNCGISEIGPLGYCIKVVLLKDPDGVLSLGGSEGSVTTSASLVCALKFDFRRRVNIRRNYF